MVILKSSDLLWPGIYGVFPVLVSEFSEEWPKRNIETPFAADWRSAPYHGFAPRQNFLPVVASQNLRHFLFLFVRCLERIAADPEPLLNRKFE